MRNSCKILFLSFFLGFSKYIFAASIAIFIPEIDSVSKTSSILKSDPILKGSELFVFAKYKDFQSAIAAKDFDYIMTPAPLASSNSKFEPAFQAMRDGDEKFSYLLIALDKKWTGADSQNATVALVEILERNELKGFLEGIFHTDKFKRIKGISKAEDIFPIMVIGNADLAVVSPLMYESIKEKFTSTPIEVKKSAAVKHFLVARNVKNSGSIEFSKLGKETLNALGASSLKRL